MKIIEKGRYWEIPIAGLTIKKLIFDGLITLVFNDSEESYLELHSAFKVSRYDYTVVMDPREKNSLVFFYDHFGQSIKAAKADKRGNFWLTFENGTEIAIEDGPFENWHYTKRGLPGTGKHLYIHGGIGRTTISQL